MGSTNPMTENSALTLVQPPIAVPRICHNPDLIGSLLGTAPIDSVEVGYVHRCGAVTRSNAPWYTATAGTDLQWPKFRSQTVSEPRPRLIP